MIVFSIITYFIVAGWFFFGNAANQRISTFWGTCLSSFFAFWYWGEDNILMIIYLGMGLICVFFHWVAIDEEKMHLRSKNKNKVLAAFLALLFGCFGIHRFYLRKNASGLLYLLFSWSGIPGILGFLGAIRLFAMTQTKFDQLYNGITYAETPETSYQRPTQTQPLRDSDRHNTFVEDDSYIPKGSNMRDGDALNYRDIRVGGYRAEVVGTVEDFAIVIKTNGDTYVFKAKGGDICSYRSSSMRRAMHYEVN